MRSLIIRILINAAALWIAAQLVGGISLEGSFGEILLVAVIFGLVNAFLKPIAKLLTFPVILLTLGLFTLVVNAVMLLITDAVTGGLAVEDFWSALIGGFIISVVSWVLSVFLQDD